MSNALLTERNYYHICLQGIAGEKIFREEKNYLFFLQQYNFYCSNVFDMLAYALMEDHVHLLVRVSKGTCDAWHEDTGVFQTSADLQLISLLNSYSQAFNNAYDRKGDLFELPFEYKQIKQEHQLTAMICYCHRNAEMHGITEDFKQWPWSSYHAISGNDRSIISVDKVLSFFGGVHSFRSNHSVKRNDEALAEEASLNFLCHESNH